MFPADHERLFGCSDAAASTLEREIAGCFHQEFNGLLMLNSVFYQQCPNRERNSLHFSYSQEAIDAVVSWNIKIARTLGALCCFELVPISQDLLYNNDQRRPCKENVDYRRT